MALSEARSASEGNLIALLYRLEVKPDGLYLTEDDIRRAARITGLPPSTVEGVATFYKMFGRRRRGRYIIRVCESPVCYIKGATNVVRTIEKLLGIGVGETTDDGLFTLEMVQCIGQCDRAPAMLVNERVYGDLTEEKIAAILDELRRAG